MQKGIEAGLYEGSPLAGVPVSVKDNICTKGVKTSCASKIMGDFAPVYNATVIDRLEKAGGVVIGKLNMDEFAMGSTTETSYYGAHEKPVGSYQGAGWLFGRGGRSRGRRRGGDLVGAQTRRQYPPARLLLRGDRL